jgi:hypothetical protein
VFHIEWRKALIGDVDLIVSGIDCLGAVCTRGRRGYGASLTCVFVGDDDGCVRQNGAGRVAHDAGKDAFAGLRVNMPWHGSNDAEDQSKSVEQESLCSLEAVSFRKA